jgi:2,3,4,5-tetrahydropyridine-2-carboxylate N-succinyltransferase
VERAIELLDSGEARVAEPGADGWTVNQWLKKAVLLSFRLNDMNEISGGPGGSHWWDKVPSKFADWESGQFRHAGFRAVPGAIVRRGAFIGRNAVLMPSFVNIGAYVGENTMIDTWATVGSCAQIGRNVHISGGTGIGGVLEPLQAGPRRDRGRLLHRRPLRSRRGRDRGAGRGPLHGRVPGRQHQDRRPRHRRSSRGRVPAYSVVVPGSLPDPNGGPSLACAVIVKRVDAQTRSKTGSTSCCGIDPGGPRSRSRQRPPPIACGIGIGGPAGACGVGVGCWPLRPKL